MQNIFAKNCYDKHHVHINLAFLVCCLHQSMTNSAVMEKVMYSIMYSIAIVESAEHEYHDLGDFFTSRAMDLT